MKSLFTFLFSLALSTLMSAQISYLIDFGKNDGTNGNETSSPDASGLYWNNMSNSTAGQTLSLIDTDNNNTSVQAILVVTFGSNGRLNGGLLNPSPALLGDMAIETATEDYFFLTGSPGSDEIEFSGLNANSSYTFTFFGTRATSITRITDFSIEGQAFLSGSLQTSGANIGSNGTYDGNDDEVLVLGPINPNAQGVINVNMGVNTGGFAYLGAIKIEETATLPVRFHSFSGQVEDGMTFLNWSTASELNNAFFDIEHSKNGRDFVTIGRVEGNGTTIEPQYYSFKDEKPLDGLNMYRLKQVDLDGNSQYSNNLSIYVEEEKTDLILYPNPALSELNLILPRQMEEDSKLLITDQMGRILLEEDRINPSMRVDLSSLNNGHYLIQVINHRDVISKQFIKQ